LKRAAQMAFADVKFNRQRRQAVAVEPARFDAARGFAREMMNGVGWRVARRQIGATSQARAKSGALGRRRRREEPAVLGPGAA